VWCCSQKSRSSAARVSSGDSFSLRPFVWASARAAALDSTERSGKTPGRTCWGVATRPSRFCSTSSGLAIFRSILTVSGCCAFRGGPFLESRFFGEGVGIAVKRGNDLLRQALNWALFRQWEKGSFTDLWLRYFPINPF